jgi:hypothetical protein
MTRCSMFLLCSQFFLLFFFLSSILSFSAFFTFLHRQFCLSTPHFHCVFIHFFINFSSHHIVSLLYRVILKVVQIF